MNVTAYARHRGVSHVAVIKAINDGRIEKEPDGTIDPIKADEQWAKNTNQAHNRRKPQTRRQISEDPKQKGPSYAQSRAIKEAYNARLAKLAYEERSGQLVSVDAIKTAWFNTLRVLRDRTLNIADRLSPILSAETDQRRITELLDKELRQILDDAANAVQNKNMPLE